MIRRTGRSGSAAFTVVGSATGWNQSPCSATALFSTSSNNENSNSNNNNKPSKKKYKPKGKKIKINPTWEKEYDKDALSSAFESMAKKEGFDDSMAYFADDETFEDEFADDDFVDDDDDFLDFGSEVDDNASDDNDESDNNNPQSAASMAERIAAARQNIVAEQKEEKKRSSATTREQLTKLGFRHESQPYGPDDETPRRAAYKLVTNARTCTACGADFQSKDEGKPGFLPPDKHEVQRKLGQIEEMQKLQEKADAFEWSAEDEIEWLIQTSSGGSEEEGEQTTTTSPQDIDIPSLAEELGLDLEKLATKKVICKRCHGLQNFGSVEESLRPGHTDEPLLSQQAFRDLLKPIRDKPAVIIALVDLFDFSGSVLPELDAIAGENNPVILAANKADLLPDSMGQIRAENWVRRELEYLGIQSLSNQRGVVRLVSCKTGFGVTALMAKARGIAADMDCDDIYVVGAANAGKSTLINHMLAKNEEKKPYQTSYKPKKKRAGNANAHKGGVTTSPLPGTTLKFIKIDLGDNKSLYDTPGLLVPGTLTQLLTPEELKMVVPKKKVEAITFRVAAGKCVLVGGLARIEVVGDSKPFLFTFFVGNDIKLHPTDTDKADAFVKKHAGTGLLTPPLGEGSAERLGEFRHHDLEIDGAGWKEAAVDISLQGLGWVAVTGAGKAKVRVSLPKGIGISVRPPLMPFDVWEATAKYTGGRAVRKSGKTMSGKRRKGVGRR